MKKLEKTVKPITYKGKKLYLRNVIWEQTLRSHKIGIEPPNIDDVLNVFSETLESGCPYCGAAFVLGHKMFRPTLDHKIPLSRGGNNNRSNFVVCCWRCNRLKHTMTTDEFMSVMDGMGDYMRYADSDTFRNRFNNRFNELKKTIPRKED